MKTREAVAAELDAKIPLECVSERQGGGNKSLSYLETHYVIDRLNQVLGHGFWSFEMELTPVFGGQMTDRSGREMYGASYLCKGKLFVRLGQSPNTQEYIQTSYQDVGYGDGQDPTHPGKAHELASKEAASDALKRCARNLGQSMGLALYDKTRKNVEVTEAPEKEPGGKVRPVAPGRLGKVEGINPTTATPSKAEVIKLIANTAKVLISMKKTTGDAISEAIQTKYGASSRDHLSLDQANEFLTTLKGQLNG